jgi:hypothetical protein
MMPMMNRTVSMAQRIIETGLLGGGKTKKYVLKLKRTIESATHLPTWRAVPST